MSVDLAQLGIEIDATQVTPAATKLDGLAAAGGRAEAATKKTTVSAKEFAAALAANGNNLDKATKAVSGLANAHSALAPAASNARVALRIVGKEAEDAAGHVQGSSLKIRESLVLMREASRGNFTRMAGSASILAGAFGLLTAANVGLIVGVVALAAPFVLVALAMERGAEAAARLSNALAVTNNYAGMTSSSAAAMAQRIAKSSGESIRSVEADITQLVATGKFSAHTIELMVTSAERFSQFTGQTTESVLKDYEAMKGGVVKWAVKHEESYHDLTLAQIDYLDKLEKQGKHEQAEAQLMQDIHDGIYSKAAPAYGYLAHAMKEVETAASNMWGAIMNWGKPATATDKITRDLQEIAAAQAMFNNPSSGMFTTKETNKAQAASNLKAAYANLRRDMGSAQAEKDKAAADAARAQAEDDKIRKKYDRNDHTKATPYRDGQLDNARGQLRQLQDETKAQLGYNNALESGSRSLDELKRAEAVDNDLKALTIKYNADMASGDAKKRAEATKLLPVINQLRVAYGFAYDEKLRGEILRQNDAMGDQNKVLLKEIELAGKSNDERAIAIAQYKTMIALGDKANTPEGKEQIRLSGQNAQGGLTNARAALKNNNIDAGQRLGTNAVAATLASNPQNYIQQQQAAYAEIERLRQIDKLSDQQAAQAKAQVDAAILDQRLSAASSFFGELATLSNAKNKELAAIGKAASIVQATIDGYAAVNKTLSFYPAPVNFIMAAGVGIAAAANVAKIAGLAGGGTVTGFGGSRSDGELRMLSPGEEVINAQAANSNRPLLKAINAGHNVGNTIKLVIEDHGTAKSYTQVPGLSHGEVRLIARDEAAKGLPAGMASEAAKPNSQFRRTLAQHTNTTRKMSA
jgi:phage-related minor tail protein